MATLAEQRAQIAEGMRRSRQGTSEASRRATGQAMIERRTGRAEVDDINALVNQPRQRRSLPAVEPRGSVAPQRGRGNYAAPAGGTGGGIAGPLTEVETAPGSGLALREYHEGETLFYATDYIMAVEIRPLKSTTMVDGTGASVPLVFQRPVTGGGGDVR
ncbi:hypothetical protein ACNFCJ_23860 [Pseudomonas sp. NY15364]|uniref:hypothetical protein n=1 Tax=Pseudomonas sp. NY15364 TaxID=3400353 RepID=UPI003A8A6E73